MQRRFAARNSKQRLPIRVIEAGNRDPFILAKTPVGAVRCGWRKR